MMSPDTQKMTVKVLAVLLGLVLVLGLVAPALISAL
jgi:hypothetical protein